ncbi:MAG: hypothetical protein ACRERC_07320 [Candidatus Binatia bacterium]
MAAGPRERLASLIKDVEKAAKQLRADIRKRAQAAPKSMEKAADALRKGAADIAGQVEKYVHDLRMNLEGKKPAKPRKAAARTKTRRAKPRAKRA